MKPSMENDAHVVDDPSAMEVFSHPETGQLVVNGYVVPYVRAGFHKGGRATLSLDHRFGIEGTADEVRRWAEFLSHALAVAHGYSCHGVNSRPMSKMRRWRVGRSLARRVYRAMFEDRRDA